MQAPSDVPKSAKYEPAFVTIHLLRTLIRTSQRAVRISGGLRSRERADRSLPWTFERSRGERRVKEARTPGQEVQAGLPAQRRRRGLKGKRPRA